MQIKRDTWMYGLAGLIVLAEASILVAALIPDVDPTYRAYFIDRTTDCYPLPVSGAYMLGDRVPFGPSPNGAKRVAVARCGWRDPDPQGGSWSDGDRSMLRFAVGRQQTDLVLALDLYPYLDADTPVQKVEVSANGRFVQTLELTNRARTNERVVIPVETIDASGILDVTLLYPNTQPLAGPAGTGKRSYAVFLYELMLVPAGETVHGPAPGPAASH